MKLQAFFCERFVTTRFPNLRFRGMILPANERGLFDETKSYSICRPGGGLHRAGACFPGLPGRPARVFGRVRGRHHLGHDGLLPFAVLLARKPVWLVSLCALVFSYGIEFSQIYHAPWIDSVRATTLGGLVLGQGFLVSDLICYAAGILIALLIDTLIEGIRRRNTPPKRQNRYIKWKKWPSCSCKEAFLCVILHSAPAAPPKARRFAEAPAFAPGRTRSSPPSTASACGLHGIWGYTAPQWRWRHSIRTTGPGIFALPRPVVSLEGIHRHNGPLAGR